MTRYAIVADLNRCVGCQTCTSACKHANATAPGVQWRKVLDFEVGEFPEVKRAFVPVGCMHCEDPPCMDVCPSKATKKRQDGIVTIDYDICIGCAYCAVACPYQARWRVDLPNAAFGGLSMRHEVSGEHWERRGVAQKCTFCTDRIDPGIAKGLTPGIDPEATPACVNSCIADALHFGDTDDPDSNVSRLLSDHKHYRMHEDVGTGPGFHYLWDRGDNNDTTLEPAPMVAEPFGLSAVSPQLQTSWDWRAAANFIGGGTGTGLFAATAFATFFKLPVWPIALLALAFVAIGLFCVWLEIGRPWRFLNVYANAKTSWMTREALVALPFFGLAILAFFTSSALIWLGAAAAGLTFLYCQGRILFAAKGIPAWRQAGIVPLIMTTGITEGMGLFAVIAMFAGLDATQLQITSAVLSGLILIRFLSWKNYRRLLGRTGAPTETFKALDAGYLNLSLKSQLVVLVIAAMSFAIPMLLIPAGALALVTGWAFKFTLITRAAFNQGFEVVRMPVRGAGKSAPGIKPGWTLS
jgi:Fe-S-cluster-containing dehydrogenase component/DMSO reductase anchor subunit